MNDNRLDTPRCHDTATEGLDWTRPLVTIRCAAYNQEPYIRDALEGFVMQQTTFPFEAIVHDDASTDGTADIIREYAEKYPHIIKPIFETENQYSKHDGSLARIMRDAMSPEAQYVAICEGDDCWISPHKLQLQVNFMQKHEDYSMCWTNGLLENCRTGVKNIFNRYPKSCDSQVEDIIEKGGEFIPTCSIVVRADVYFNIPNNAKGYYCGDYPLQVWTSHIGKTYYFADVTCSYRAYATGSWTNKVSAESKEQRLKRFYDEKRMLDGLNEATEYKHVDSFEIIMANNLFYLATTAGEYDLAKPYLFMRDKFGINTDNYIRCLIQKKHLKAHAIKIYRKLRRRFM